MCLLRWATLLVCNGLTGRLRPDAEFEVDRVNRRIPRHLQGHAALVTGLNCGHGASFAKGTNDCWPSAQICNKRVRVVIWTGLFTGNLSHSWFGEVQLENPSGDNFQVPGEGPVEVWEKRGLSLNNVARAGGLCAV